MTWIDTPVTADLVRGALELEPTAHGVLPHRLPARARAQCADGQLAMAEAQPSGVRLVFRTRATAVELDALPHQEGATRAPRRARTGVYDLLVDGRLAGQAQRDRRQRRSWWTWPAGPRRQRPGPVGTVRFDGLPGRTSRTSRSGCPTTRSPSWSRCAPTPPSSPLPDRGRQGVAAPRQLDQPRLRRREPHDHLAGAGRVPRRRGADQPGAGRQCPARPVHRPRDAGHPGGPDQRQDRHQSGQRRPDAPARLRAGGARLPRHDPRGPSHHSAAGRLAHPVPDPRGHPRPQRSRTSSNLAEGRLQFRADGRPRGTGPREADADRHPGRAGPHRRSSGQPTTRTCTTSTAASSTARRTSPSCRCPTSSTRTPPPTAASASASPRWPSAPAGRSPTEARAWSAAQNNAEARLRRASITLGSSLPTAANSPIRWLRAWSRSAPEVRRTSSTRRRNASST